MKFISGAEKLFSTVRQKRFCFIEKDFARHFAEVFKLMLDIAIGKLQLS